MSSTLSFPGVRCIRFSDVLPTWRPGRGRSRRCSYRTRPCVEQLENRMVLSVTLSGVPDWIEQGPGPVATDGINNFGVELEQAGAINGIAADPNDANRMFVGTVGGGVWRTTTATYSREDSVDNDGDTLVDEDDEFVHWEPLTDHLAGTAMGDVAISRLDSNTIFAGFANFSSGGGDGGPLNGVIKSTDGGNTWAPVGENNELSGFRIQHILPTSIGTPATQVVLLGTANGLFRSANGGDTWDLISGTDGSSDGLDNNDDGTVDEAGEINLPSGGLTYLIGDPGDEDVYYAGLPTVGVLRSDDGGLSWQNVTNNINTISPGVVATSTRVQLGTHDSGTNVVYATIWPAGLAYAAGDGPDDVPQNPIQVFRSTDQGGTWTRLDDFPDVPDIRGPGGIQADPNYDDVLFMHGAQGGAGGDPIGNHGRVWRLDAGAAAGSQWLRVTGVNAGGFGPHPDSRYIVFDANGDLLDSDDGGLFRLVDPNNDNNARIWRSVNGNIRGIEFYSVAYDPLNNTVFGGTQDNGSPRQRDNADPDYPFDWSEPQNCDGGIVAVDTDYAAHPGETIQYLSGQNLFACGFNRYTVDATNTAASVAVGAVVDNTNNNTLGPIENTIPGGRTLGFIQPYELNVVAPTQMLIGTAFLWESTNQGDNLTALGGLQDVNADGIDNDGDMATDEGDEFQPITPIGNLNTDGLDNDGAGRDDDGDGMVDEADEIDEGDEFARTTAIAYGGRLNGVDAPDVLYIGKGARDGRGGLLNGQADNILLRTVNATNTMADFTTLTAYPGTAPRDIVLDPDNWQIGYVIDRNDNVYRFTNAGATAADWSLITGNLPSLFQTTSLRTIELFTPSEIAGDDVLLVGGTGGVYRTLNPTAGPDTVWTEFNNPGPANHLPNPIVKDLRYTPPTDAGMPFPGDVLLAGTWGRGAWTIENASEVLLEAPVMNVCGDEQYVNQDDAFRLVLNAGDPTMVDVFVNGAGPTTVSLALIQQINVFGVGGNDSLTVDSSNGLIQVPFGIRYNGDGACPESQPGFGYDRGFDTLILDQDGGDVQDVDFYAVGPAIGSGTSLILGPSGTQSIFFEELEPVIDLVPATDLVVTATAEPNAINYVGGTSVFNGRITIDNYEAIEFRGKVHVSIDAGLGNDTINLNNVNTPADLSDIFVDAGDGDDVVTTRSTIAVLVNFAGGAGNDVLDASGATVGAIISAGGGDDVLIGGPGDDGLLGDLGDDLLLGGAGDNSINGGPGFDTLAYRGTGAGDAIFADQTAVNTLAYRVNSTTGTDTVTDINLVHLDAGLGDDLITVRVAHVVNNGSLAFRVTGDGPNASDRLAVIDDGDGNLIVSREAPDRRSGSITVGAKAPVSYDGIETTQIVPLDPVTGGTGDDGEGRIVVFDTDPFEANDSRLNFTTLDALDAAPVRPNVDPGAVSIGDPDGVPVPLPGDEDWYKFHAHKIGTFRFDVFFEEIGTLGNGQPGLPGDGDLDIAVYSASGSLIVSGSAMSGGEQAMFSAAAGNNYFLRVRGSTPNAINVYDVNLVEVDLLGPQVTDVTVTGSNYDLFDPKPSTAGPTPMVTSLTISLRDLLTRSLLVRAPGDVYPALDAVVAIQDGHYLLVGDHNGIIPISNILVTNDPVAAGQMATATIELQFAAPIPDDRYTFTIFDTLLDPPGNRADGENNAAEPHESPLFPTGDGVAGGDFVARFTIDSRPEIGAYALGTTYLDINGNFFFDPEGHDDDYTNRDIVFVFGFRDDKQFAGNFAPANAASASGFDKLGSYGTQGQGQAWHWRLDFDHDGVIDYDVVSGGPGAGDPFAGDFSATHPGDEIGLFNGGKWYLDTGGDNNIGGVGDTLLQGNMKGTPVVGDFDGDGLDDLGTWDAGNAGSQFDGVFQFDLANNGLTGNVEQTLAFDLPGTFQYPVAADMNGDGIDDLGLFVTRREAIPPAEAAEWFFLISNAALAQTGQVTALNHAFEPVPFGDDLFAQFGDESARPIVGNFDPPVASGGLTPDAPRGTNPNVATDVNNDGFTTPLDALLIIGRLNTEGAGAWWGVSWRAPFVDVSADSQVTPLDALLVINELVARNSGESEPLAATADSLGNVSFASVPDSVLASAWTTVTDLWQEVGLAPSELSALQGVEFYVTDLPGRVLAFAFPGAIVLDRDAAGHGWFVEPTSGISNLESEISHSIDLLTVLTHEAGHLLGMHHGDSLVMSPTLSPGQRRLPANPAPAEEPNSPLAASLPVDSTAAVRTETWATFVTSLPTVPAIASEVSHLAAVIDPRGSNSLRERLVDAAVQDLSAELLVPRALRRASVSHDWTAVRQRPVPATSATSPMTAVSTRWRDTSPVSTTESFAPTTSSIETTAEPSSTAESTPPATASSWTRWLVWLGVSSTAWLAWRRGRFENRQPSNTPKR